MSAININAGFTKNMGQLIRSRERDRFVSIWKKKKEKSGSKTSSLFFHVPFVTRDNSIPNRGSRARCSIWNINFEFAALVAQRLRIYIAEILKKKKRWFDWFRELLISSFWRGKLNLKIRKRIFVVTSGKDGEDIYFFLIPLTILTNK